MNSVKKIALCFNPEVSGTVRGGTFFKVEEAQVHVKKTTENFRGTNWQL